MARSRKPRRCLCGVCGGEPRSRGLSNGCYQAARRDVALGKTTWEELEAVGKALPATPRHKCRRSPIGKVIDELAASRG